MNDQVTKAKQFADLHIKSNPIIIYNAWDGGSAKTIASAGAKAIATGDHPVGFAHGYNNDNFDEFSFDSYLGTIKDIARAIDLPFSVDISNGEGLDIAGLQSRIVQLLEIGIIGINFEDRLDDSTGVKPLDEQIERIEAIRTAADNYGVPLFINARSDLFVTGSSASPDELLQEAIKRAQAYKEAGANGFFVPGLMDIDLIHKLCDAIELPVNIIRLPGAPETAELKQAGVSRISYGPVVQMETMAWLKDKASQVFTEN